MATSVFKARETSLRPAFGWKPESKCFPLKEGGQGHNPDAEGT